MSSNFSTALVKAFDQKAVASSGDVGQEWYEQATTLCPWYPKSLRDTPGYKYPDTRSEQIRVHTDGDLTDIFGAFEVYRAVGSLLKHVAAIPGGRKPYVVEAQALLESEERAWAVVQVMSIVPRDAAGSVPKTLCGLLELVLRAAENDRHEGLAKLGLPTLSSRTWLCLECNFGKTSHDLLRIWGMVRQQISSLDQRKE